MLAGVEAKDKSECLVKTFTFFLVIKKSNRFRSEALSLLYANSYASITPTTALVLQLSSIMIFSAQQYSALNIVYAKMFAPISEDILRSTDSSAIEPSEFRNSR